MSILISAKTVWIDSPTEVLYQNLLRYSDRVLVAVTEVAKFFAVQLQDEARLGAKWVDRTGFARKGLVAFIDQVSKDIVDIYLTTQAPYGKWLELANSGRYAIIMPTIVRNLPEIQTMLNNIFR